MLWDGGLYYDVSCNDSSYKLVQHSYFIAACIFLELF